MLDRLSALFLLSWTLSSSFLTFVLFLYSVFHMDGGPNSMHADVNNYRIRIRSSQPFTFARCLIAYDLNMQPSTHVLFYLV